MPDKQFLTIGEVANLLQVSNRTVYNLIYKGTLRACRLTYHITLITKEDFFLMIKEATYCKRNISMFAKQCKKTKKMKKEKNTEIESLSRQEGKKKPKSSPKKRQLIPAANYKQSVRDTFTDKEDAGNDLYTLAEICQKFNYTYGRFYNLRMRYSIPCINANSTKCFPKTEVDKAMAEDAVQHVFTRFWEFRSELRVGISLKNYLVTMTKNHILNVIRNENNAIAKNYEIAQSIPEYEDTLIENLEKKEMMSLFYKALDKLPPQKREICLMKVRDELTNPEIAERMQLSVNTIKTHYSEALKLLRAHLHKLLIFVTYLTLLKYLSVLFILWIIR